MCTRGRHKEIAHTASGSHQLLKTPAGGPLWYKLCKDSIQAPCTYSTSSPSKPRLTDMASMPAVRRNQARRGSDQLEHKQGYIYPVCLKKPLQSSMHALHHTVRHKHLREQIAHHCLPKSPPSPLPGPRNGISKPDTGHGTLGLTQRMSRLSAIGSTMLSPSVPHRCSFITWD